MEETKMVEIPIKSHNNHEHSPNGTEITKSESTANRFSYFQIFTKPIVYEMEKRERPEQQDGQRQRRRRRTAMRFMTAAEGTPNVMDWGKWG